MTCVLRRPGGTTDHSDTELRRCRECQFDVNRFEWQTCRKNNCPMAFNLLDPMSVSPESTVADNRIQPGQQIDANNKRLCIAKQGMVCPFCLSDEITTFSDSIDAVENNKLTRRMVCRSHHAWHEVFIMTNVLTDEQHRYMYPPK